MTDTKSDALYEAIEALKECALIFRGYELHHMQKGNIEGDVKARRNCEYAEKCEALIRKIEREHPKS